jgi:glucosylceramidase
MRTLFLSAIIIFVFALMMSCSRKSVSASVPVIQPPVERPDVTFWLTKSDRSVLLQQQNGALIFSEKPNNFLTVSIDSAQEFQAIDGFGYTLTGGSALLINAMAEQQRNALLQELFGNGEGSIGISYLRLSIGASDLSDTVFTYDEVPPGNTDTNLSNK